MSVFQVACFGCRVEFSGMPGSHQVTEVQGKANIGAYTAFGGRVKRGQLESEMIQLQKMHLSSIL